MSSLLNQDVATVPEIPADVRHELIQRLSLVDQGNAIASIRESAEDLDYGDRLSVLGFLLLDASVALRQREAAFV